VERLTMHAWWRRGHLILGIAGVLTFLATGLYMRMNFPALYGSQEAARYLYRANHAYILYAGLLNLVLGTYLVARREPWKRLAQRLGSGLVVVAPVLLVWAFVVEPSRVVPERPRTSLGAMCALSGTLLHVVGAGMRRSAVG
jgi:hypothetical protein